MSEKYKNLKVKELQELLQKNDMPYTGKKEDLVERLVKLDERKAMENLEKEFELEDDFDESKLILTEDIQTDAIFSSLILDKPTFYEKESVLSDDEEDLTPVAKKSVSPKVKAVTPPVTEPVLPSPTTTTTTTTTAAVEITLQESVTSTEVAPPSSFKFTPITFESKTVQPEPPKKPTPAKKLTAATPTTKSANTTKSNSKPVVSKAFGSRISAPKSKSTTVNTPPKSTIRPTRSTKTPLPKSTKSNKDTTTLKAKAAPTSTTMASLAVQEKKAPLTAEQIEKARLEAERKLERSKRFGIKLDEKDMKEIRAARFGIIATTNTEGEKKKEKGKTTKETAAQDILKKRAERFGIPQKKIVPTNHKKLMTVTKNAVKQGRVQKMAPKTELIKAVTKSNILNKKHNNIATRLNAPIVAQNKRIVKRKTDTPIQGRVITIAPIRSAPVRQVKTSARDIIINANNNIRRPTNNTKKPVSKDIGNGRTVTVGTSNNNKRRRGRGPESSHQPL
ncbi:hypothetical protein INT47_006571, partial [Mucor saturninus]